MPVTLAPLTFRLISGMRAPSLVRLIALPYAGGSITALRTLLQNAPPGVDVVGLEMPGRGLAHEEAPIFELASLLDRLEAALSPLLFEMPVLLLGYSFGALVAAELVRRLQIQAMPLPLGLIACSAKAPRRIAQSEAFLPTSDEETLHRLQSLGGIPDEVLAHGELMDLALPAIRADLTCYAQYRRPSPLPLACPVLAQYGAEDTSLSPVDVEAWRAEVTLNGHASSRIRAFPGGHFFHHDHEPQCREAIWNWARDLGLSIPSPASVDDPCVWEPCST